MVWRPSSGVGFVLLFGGGGGGWANDPQVMLAQTSQRDGNVGPSVR